jgi:hypothetical protein
MLEATVWHQRRGFGSENAFLGRISIPIIGSQPVPTRWYILNQRGRDGDFKIHGKIRVGVIPIGVEQSTTPSA